VPALLATGELFGAVAGAVAAPATKQDIAIYQAMGTSFFCMAALDGVEFPEWVKKKGRKQKKNWEV